MIKWMVVVRWKAVKRLLVRVIGLFCNVKKLNRIQLLQ